jgi:MoaA/NifB/PqqE/SkfB family radical SAM enzyme
MENMSMQDFLQEYARNMLASLWDKDNTLRSMNFNCEFCPFRDICHNDDTDRDCAKLIADHISDMQDFKER